MAWYDRVLVTGSRGLVGSAIMDRGYESPEVIGVTSDQFNLLHWKETDDMLRKFRPDAIIHLAAKVGGVKANMKSPATFFMENLTMNTHLLEAARIHCVKRVICFLSTCVFPDPCPLPLDPKNLHAGPPHPSNYGYAFAKRMLAVQCQSYNEEYGTQFVPVIPCNIYGPNDNFHLENSHVVPALIRKFYEAKLAGTPVTIWGSGKPLREFIYSDDVARLLMEILRCYESNDPIVLSTGQEHSIRQLVEIIAQAMDFQNEIIYDESKPEGQHRKPSNNEPLKTLLPDFKFRSLESGIQKTVDWFLHAWPNVRK